MKKNEKIKKVLIEEITTNYSEDINENNKEIEKEKTSNLIDENYKSDETSSDIDKIKETVIKEDCLPSIKKKIKKNHSKDLLRLEKNYFDGIYHKDNCNDIDQFKIESLLKNNKKKEKPSIGVFENSDSFILFIKNIIRILFFFLESFFKNQEFSS